jgi:hypothetical protein
VVALDILPTASARARCLGVGPGKVDYLVANTMDYDLRAGEQWGLIVMSETIYFLGWLYSVFDVAPVPHELFDSMRHGGLMLMGNAISGVEDYLLRPE